MKKLKKVVKKLTAADVDRYAVLMSQVDDMVERGRMFRRRIRKQVGPGHSLAGKAFVVNVSQEIPEYGKVDYRAECLKYMRKAGVDNPVKVMRKLECIAEDEIVNYRRSRVTVSPNPDYEPE